jgi:hypothetical protein
VFSTAVVFAPQWSRPRPSDIEDETQAATATLAYSCASREQRSVDLMSHERDGLACHQFPVAGA